MITLLTIFGVYAGLIAFGIIPRKYDITLVIGEWMRKRREDEYYRNNPPLKNEPEEK